MRTTKEMLNWVVKGVNSHLKNTQVEITSAYGYRQIEIVPKGGRYYTIKTIASGLTAREAYDILSSFIEILSTDKKEWSK